MKKIIFIAALSFAGVLSASTGDKVSPASKTSEVVEAKPKKAKKSLKQMDSQECFNAYYHGCTHAVTCVTSLQEAIEWAEKVHQNYCSK